MIFDSKKLPGYLTCIIAIMFLLIPSFVYCEVAKNDIPNIIVSGLNAYKENGPDAAINAWIKGSAYDGSKEALSQANVFRQVETFYGKYVDFSLLQITNLTPSTKIVYLTMDFEKGPVFAMFMVYKVKNGWIISGKFNFNTDPEKILPTTLLGKN